MSQAIRTRRDPRYRLASGSGSVRFVAGPGVPRERVAELSVITVAGLAFRTTDSELDIEPGTTLVDVEVFFGACRLNGSLAVRNVSTTDGQREFGCLFFPTDERNEDRWIALIEGFTAGLSAANGSGDG